MSSDGEDARERENQFLEDEGDADAYSSSSTDDNDEDKDKVEKVKKSGVSVEKLLKSILQEIADGRRNLTHSDHLATFKSKDVHVLAADTGAKHPRTALHLLLDERVLDLPKVGNEQMEALVAALVQHSNNLLAKGDREGNTPLYLAIESKREDMLKWMVEAHPNINTVLQKTSNKKLYLHRAIKKKLKYFPQLVQKADGKTLALRDARNNTILHLAVEWKRCRGDQLSVIEEIVAKSDDEVQATPNGDFNLAGNSPYLHHRKTVKSAAREAAREAFEAQKAAAGADRPPGRDRRENTKNAGGGPIPNANKTTARPPSPTRAPVLSAPVLHSGGYSGVGPQPGPDFSTEPRPATQSNSRAKYGGSMAATPPADLVRTATFADAGPDATGTQVRVESKSKPKSLEASGSNKSSKVDENVVQGVERFLKLHYLRTRSNAACTDILYGRDKVSDLELYFDLSGRSSMTQQGFQSLVKQLRFEDALQYVAIPNIRIEAPGSSNTANSSNSRRPARGQSYKEGSGRRDLVQVFNTLHQRGVRTILKVVVDDSVADEPSSPPHTDEAIEKALGGMGVEIWDWKKTDLSTEVIYAAAPRVRQVHLYWSGNNAVLRGWSEEGGLKRLSELDTVHLHVQQGIESVERTKQYVKDFSKRVGRLGFKHKLQLVIDESFAFRRQAAGASGPGWAGAGAGGRGGGPGASAGKHEQTSKHAWIDCMKRFRGLLLNAERLSANDQQVPQGIYQQVSQGIKEPIRVALIDDGVDCMDWNYPLLGGRTFYPRNEAENLNHPYYASATGHGTDMAKLINFMCPRAQLYVLRLENHLSEDGVLQLTAKSAAQAITAAVKKGVHIISMSWTIDPPDDKEVERELHNAILDADKANILMFCSAADQGARQTDTYPSRATQRIFTIGAAGPSGETNTWVGNPDKVDFTFPGDRVELMDSTPNSTANKVSGSSVATALAAGFCALVLYCVQVRLSHLAEPERAQVQREFSKLKRHEEMTKVFQTSIGTSPESKYKFITVWEVFGTAANERDRYEDPDRLIELISRIGRRICMQLMV